MNNSTYQIHIKLKASVDITHMFPCIETPKFAYKVASYKMSAVSKHGLQIFCRTII